MSDEIVAYLPILGVIFIQSEHNRDRLKRRLWRRSKMRRRDENSDIQEWIDEIPVKFEFSDDDDGDNETDDHDDEDNGDDEDQDEEWEENDEDDDK